MNIFLRISTFLLATQLIYASESPIETINNYRMLIDSQHGVGSQLPSIENDPGAIVGGCVNAITGKYFEYNVDTITRGPEPLPILRNYFSEELFYFRPLQSPHGEHLEPPDQITYTFDIDYDEEPNLYGWRLCQNNVLFIEMKTAHMYDQQGSLLKYTLNNNAYKVDPAGLKGTTNFSSGIISGQTNIKNAIVAYSPASRVFETRESDGSIRYFAYDCLSSTNKHKKYLSMEYRPTGKWIFHNQRNSNCKNSKSWTANAQNKKTYSWVEYKNISNRNEEYTLVTNSDGKTFRYEATKADAIQNTHIPDFLRSITRPDGTKEIIECYSNRFVFCGKTLPDQRRLHLTFDDEMRVKSIQKPIGADHQLKDAFTFVYGKNYTDVFDALGNHVRYHFNQYWRLTEKETFVNKQRYSLERNFYGDEKGADASNIICKSLEDAQGNLYFCRTFEYDLKGNVTKDTLHGNLTGTCKTPLKIVGNGKIEGGEKQTRYYSYLPGLDGPFNLILIEEDGKSSIHYMYLPGTSLVTAKYTYDAVKASLYHREFREYNSENFLTKIIVDDGSSRDCNHLTDCTERRITKIYYKESGPGIGQAEIIEEFFYNFETGREQLLKKLVNHYSPQNMVVKQDVYDANQNYAYSLNKEYDIMDRLISETDLQGNTFKMFYDANGNLIKKIGFGIEFQFVYDFSNRLIRKTELDLSSGQTHSENLRYDYSGNCLGKVDSFGNETTFTYDAFGRILETKLPYCFCNHEPQQSLIKQCYDIAGNVTQYCDESGRIIYKSYNTRNKLIRCTENNQEELMEYDLFGNLVKTISKNGLETVFSYDFLNRVIAKSSYHSGQLLSQETYAYKGFRLISKIDPEGYETRIYYDGAGREKLVEKHLEDGKKTKLVKEYDALGNVFSIKTWHNHSDKDFIEKRFSYDLAGKILQEIVTNQEGTIFSKINYSYDWRGNQTAVTTFPENSQGASVFTYYDGFNRPYEIVDAFGNRKRFSYNENYTNELGQKVLQTTLTDELGIKTITVFDARGRTIKCEKIGLSNSCIQSKSFSYDCVGNKIEEKETVYHPNGSSRLITHQFKYDQSHRLIQMIEEAGEPHARITRFSYNQAGEKICKESCDIRIDYLYDAFGKTTYEKAISLKNNYAPYECTYSYDLNERLVQVNNLTTNKNTKRAYNTLGQIVWEIQESGLKLAYEYDLLGRKTTLKLPDQTEVNYCYNGPFLYSLSYQGLTHIYEKRDLIGQVTQAQLMGQAGKVTYSTDLMGRSTHVESSHWSEIVPANGYDPASNLTQITTKDAAGSTTQSFGYDGNYQLISETGSFNKNFSYDSAYNRLSCNEKSYKIGKFHQLLDDGETTYEWDFLGNLTSSDGIKYCYNALSELVEVSGKSFSARYQYDGLHRRISKQLTVRDTDEAPLFYLYDDQNEIGTVTSNGEIIELRLLAEGLGAEIGATIAVKLKNTFYATINDHRGNIAALVDAKTGKLVECYRYSAYGEKQIFDSKGNLQKSSQNPWCFSSKRIDSETNLIYFGRRYYNPVIGRFITQDPIGYKDGSNLYAYTLNNPLTHYDLYGLKRAGRESEQVMGSQSFFDNAKSLFGRTFRAIGSCIEWIGKNLIPIPGLRDGVEAIGRWTAGGKLCQKAEYRNCHTISGHVGEGIVSGERYFYMNGICTTYKNFLKQLEFESSEMGGRRIDYVYNSTKGIFTDLLECIFAKFGVMTEPDNKSINTLSRLVNEVFDEMNLAGVVYAKVHSQGALHFNNASSFLNTLERSLISVEAFGPAVILNKSGFKTVKNYISKLDVVSLFSTSLYIQAVIDNLFGRASNVHFLSPTTYNPLREHFIFDPERPTTYQKHFFETFNSRH